MKIIFSLVFLHCIKTLLVFGYVYDSDYLVPPKCQPCEARLCPQLTFCAGKEVTDNCGCCSRCSSDLFQPHAVDDHDSGEVTTENPMSAEILPVNPCTQRQCPKFKVCMINVQGLPICTCPSAFVCKRGGNSKNSKDVKVCGTDGKTYESRCHLRIANCNGKRRIKQKYSGECSVNDAIDTAPNQPMESFVTDRTENQDSVFLNAVSKARRRRIKQKKRKGKKKKQRERERRRQRKEKERSKRRQGSKDRKRRRMKRRNEGFNRFDPYYLGRYTKWSRSQVRKSRI